MAVDVKQLACPKCSTPLDLKGAGRSKSIVCPSCGSQIDLTSPKFQIIGNVGNRPEPQATPFKIGMQGTLKNQTYEIIGRVVYHDDEGDIWDEWLLLSSAGEYVWISDSVNEGMALWHSYVPTEPVEPDKLEEGQHVKLRNTQVTVRDTGGARIDYLEGELTWTARVGDRMNYVEADGAMERISIEYTENEAEFYWGERLDAAATAKAFGITNVPATRTASMKSSGGIFRGVTLIGVGAISLVCLCLAITLFSGGNADSAALVCVTPSAVVAAGQPTPEPICYTPTPAPRSSGGFSFPSIRSGSSGSRSIGGGSSGHSSGGHSSGGK